MPFCVPAAPWETILPGNGYGKLSGPETGVTGQSYTFSVSSAMAGAGSFTYVVGILDGSYIPKSRDIYCTL